MKVYTSAEPIGNVFYVGCGEDERAELERAKQFVKRPSHTSNMIRYCKRHYQQEPLIEVLLETSDQDEAQTKQQALIATFPSKQLTNRLKRGV